MDPKGGGRRTANWEVWALQSCQVTPTCIHPGGLWAGRTEAYSSHPLLWAPRMLPQAWGECCALGGWMF